MKKNILIALILCVITALAVGCAKQEDDFTTRETAEPEFAEGVVMTAEFAEYDKNLEKITVTITNNGDVDFGFNGQDFSLQKDTGESWHYLSTSGSINGSCQIVEPGKSGSCTVYVGEHIKTPVSAGNYRLILGEGKKTSAEFTVK
ncbi:MAG TPA: hypothetical protein DER68_02395 [Ruminococcaceae bacterium]|nr:hypothetical protein [Oscillospiraceae bacterium]